MTPTERAALAALLEALHDVAPGCRQPDCRSPATHSLPPTEAGVSGAYCEEHAPEGYGETIWAPIWRKARELSAAFKEPDERLLFVRHRSGVPVERLDEYGSIAEAAEAVAQALRASLAVERLRWVRPLSPEDNRALYGQAMASLDAHYATLAQTAAARSAAQQRLDKAKAHLNVLQGALCVASPGTVHEAMSRALSAQGEAVDRLTRELEVATRAEGAARGVK